MTTRRGFLGGLAGAFATAVVGIKSKAEANPFDWKFTRYKTGTVVEIKPLPAWDVGAGEMDWRVIFAETKEEAQKIWFEEEYSEDPDAPCECGCGAAHFACETHSPGLPEARRAPHWDNPKNAEPSWADCFNHGWTICCERCGYEQSRDNGECDTLPAANREYADIIVCHDCMTDDELRSVCPDHYRFDDEEEEAEA